MIFFTMQDAITELRPRINGGTCRDETAISRINQATRRIMNRPRKPIHVERVIRFFTRKDFITLPREVEKVLHYTMDGAPAPLFGRAYEFVSGGWGEVACHHPCASGKYLVDMGSHYSTMFDLPSMEAADAALDAESLAAGEGIVTGSGVTTVADLAARQLANLGEDAITDDPLAALQATSQEPLFSSFKLAAFSTSELDVTKSLSIYGRDDKNQALGSPSASLQLPIQQWHGGVEGELFVDLASMPAVGFAVSEPVRDVSNVGKPATDGFVSLYSYDETTHQMYFLAKYHPQETNPRYRRYRLTHPDFTAGSSVYALCELGYVPLTEHDDVLLVQNMDALKMMVMAIEFENEREFQAAKAYEADAYRLIEEQRTSERAHDSNLIQVSPAYGFGSIRAL